MYQYKGRIERWVDGDTVLVTLELGFYVMKEERFRLARINTPEIRGKERKEGLKVMALINDFCPVGSSVTIDSKKRDRYGRWIAEVEYNNQNISQWLLDNGHAEEVEY